MCRVKACTVCEGGMLRGLMRFCLRDLYREEGAVE